MKAKDIVVWETLFGDWEITNADNFFHKNNPNQVMTLKRADGFCDFEKCRDFLLNTFQPVPTISIIHIN